MPAFSISPADFGLGRLDEDRQREAQRDRDARARRQRFARCVVGIGSMNSRNVRSAATGTVWTPARTTRLSPGWSVRILGKKTTSLVGV